MATLGTSLMKLGHMKACAAFSKDGTKTQARSVRDWQVGAFLFALGNVSNFASFAFAAQSLLASFGTVEFVFHAAFAKLILKEVLTLHVLTGTAGVILGLILLVIFGNRASNDLTASELMTLYENPGYIAFLAVAGVTFLMACGVYYWGREVVQPDTKPVQHSFVRRVLPFSYSMLSAIIGSQSVLFSKCLSTLLRKTISGENQAGSWFTWVCLFLFLCTAGFWVVQLNKGLQMFDVLVIVPLMQICWTLSAIVSGGIYFHEFQDFSRTQAAAFCAGIAIAVGSVYILITGGGSMVKVSPEPGRDSLTLPPQQSELQQCVGASPKEGPEERSNMPASVSPASLRRTSVCSPRQFLGLHEGLPPHHPPPWSTPRDSASFSPPWFRNETSMDTFQGPGSPLPRS